MNQRALALSTLVLLATSCGDAGKAVAPESDGLITLRQAKYSARVELGTLGGTSSFANDINDAGVVVGSAQTSSGQTHAYRWTVNGGMVDLGALPGHDYSAAIDVDDAGIVLGVSGVSWFGSCCQEGTQTDVVWDAVGTISTLNRPFAVPAGFFSIRLTTLPNAAGQWAATVVGPPNPGTGSDETAFFFSPASGLINLRALGIASGVDPSVLSALTYSLLTAMNERGTVLQTGGGEDQWRPVLWNATTGFVSTGIPPGANPADTRVLSRGMNNLDEIVGWYQSVGLGPSFDIVDGPYRWAASTGFVPLPDPYGDGVASAINDNGEAVGFVLPFEVVAAAWPRKGGLRLLETSPGHNSFALAINAEGLAIGWEATGGRSGETHALLWNTHRVHIVPGSKAKGPRSKSAFATAVSRCLTRPGTKTQRVRCLASPLESQ